MLGWKLKRSLRSDRSDFQVRMGFITCSSLGLACGTRAPARDGFLPCPRWKIRPGGLETRVKLQR
eukprot:3714825-Pyramimonas_sp.AAC.2